jgi:hypothetical protein
VTSVPEERKQLNEIERATVEELNARFHNGERRAVTDELIRRMKMSAAATAARKAAA